MKIENLIRERVIGNIKTGTKSEQGLPKKLPFFNVEEDKATDIDMVNIFKQVYPGQPKVLKIRFTNEMPFSFRYKRYVKNKPVCIGNGTKAITIGKNEKGYSEQIEVECGEQCEHLLTGKCKLVGSLKFILEGIEAGGVWKINTTGGLSLSNIASEIMKYKKAGMSIVNVPFELKLTEQESLAYGIYYSLDLKRTDIKPQITGGELPIQNQEVMQGATTKKIAEGESKKIESNVKTEEKETKAKEPKKLAEQTKKEAEKVTKEIPKVEKEEQQEKEDFSDIFYVMEISDTLLNNKKFKKIILQDLNSQDSEYILHPKASQDILKYGIGTIIKLTKSEIQVGKNIICKYDIKQIPKEDGTLIDFNNELKEAV